MKSPDFVKLRIYMLRELVANFGIETGITRIENWYEERIL